MVKIHAFPCAKNISAYDWNVIEDIVLEFDKVNCKRCLSSWENYCQKNTINQGEPIMNAQEYQECLDCQEKRNADPEGIATVLTVNLQKVFEHLGIKEPVASMYFNLKFNTDNSAYISIGDDVVYKTTLTKEDWSNIVSMLRPDDYKCTLNFFLKLTPSAPFTITQERLSFAGEVNKIFTEWVTSKEWVIDDLKEE